MKGQLGDMMARHAHPGRVVWIGLRPARRAPYLTCDTAFLDLDGLAGDHARAGKRAVTLIQAEHLPVMTALAGSEVTADMLRRNIGVAGINLAGLRKDVVRIGDAIVQIEGPCPPCSRMEEIIGPGGYNAVRGHGGWYASVVKPGDVRLQDPVTRAEPE